MKKLYFLTSTFVFAGVIMLSTVNTSMTNSLESPFMNTGSEGDGANNTCAKSGCHSTNPPNTGSGTLDIDLSDIPAGGWAKGETYDITVSLSDGSRTNYGFQLTVENPADNSKSGSILTGSNMNVTLVGPTNQKDWISHRTVSSTGSWTFQWTAPNADIDSVKFYAAGNAANGNGLSSGDNIYTTSKAMARDLTIGVSELSEVSFAVLQNPASQNLLIHNEEPRDFNIFSMNGSRIMSFRAEFGNQSIDISRLKSGIYLLTSADGSISQRIAVH